jgi:hypothetical protein
MKIQFIIVGWHFDTSAAGSNYIDGLLELTQINNNVDVFWVCHKDPPSIIKDNFEWSLFPNGEEFVAYEQFYQHKKLDDDTLCFFTHDDIIIKDWGFIEKCYNLISQGFKAIGNGINYMCEYDPFEKGYPEGNTSILLPNELREYVKKSHQHLFDKKLNIRTLRGSFMCLKYGDLKHINGFEPREDIREKISEGRFLPDENGKFMYIHEDGRKEKVSGYGNVIQTTFCYKLVRVFGNESIIYLGKYYLNSEYIYECGRGNIDPNSPMI